MKFRMLKCITATTIFLALALPVRLAAQEEQQERKKELPRYTVQDLGTLGGTFSFAQGINNKGWVEGFATLPGDQTQHSFLWVAGLKIDLGTLGGPNSGGDFGGDFRPNERGQVPGVAQTSVLDPRGLGCGLSSSPFICLPFIWQDGVKTTLPTLGGYLGGADDMNDRGQATGFAETTTPDITCPPQVPYNQSKSVIWEKGEIQELPDFSNDTDSQGFGINDSGQVVGGSGNCINYFHAVLWRHSMVIDLGNLGGTIGNIGIAINNRGQVAGNSAMPNETATHGFLWQNGVMADLGTLPGDFLSFATGINDKSQVVGSSCTMNESRCSAFLWQNGVMTDLNTLIPADSPLFLLQARTINSHGETVGFALQPSTGEIHAYLATPCEERDADNERCKDDSEGTTAIRGETSERPKVALPENVRKLLQQQLTRRYYIHPLGTEPE